MDSDGMAAFLLRYRERLRPSDVGLPAGPRRRVAGLRREEVAQLATMSVDYYTRLEQGRSSQPTTQMLAALARALRLTPDERDYLYRMAGHDAPDRHAAGGYVAPPLLRVFELLGAVPALILSDLGETLVQNEAATALFGDATGRTGFARSETWRWFVQPETARRVYPDEAHERHGQAQVAALRATLGAAGAGSRAAALVADLRRRSEEFERMWQDHAVRRRFEDHKVVLHPELGAIEVDCQVLLTEDESQALLVLTAPPGTDAASRLALLAVIGSQEFTTERP